jgi:hypothetical protein
MQHIRIYCIIETGSSYNYNVEIMDRKTMYDLDQTERGLQMLYGTLTIKVQNQ